QIDGILIIEPVLDKVSGQPPFATVPLDKQHLESFARETGNLAGGSKGAVVEGFQKVPQREANTVQHRQEFVPGAVPVGGGSVQTGVKSPNRGSLLEFRRLVFSHGPPSCRLLQVVRRHPLRG